MPTLSLPFFLSVATTIISGVFAVMVFNRWRQKHRPHLMAWTVGLTLYSLGEFSQIVLTFTWSQFFFGLWYWAGALAVAPWLGQGTVYLLMRRGSIARNIQMALLLICIMTFPWAIFLTPMNAEAWRAGSDMTALLNDILPRGGVRAFSPMMNVWGTIALVGGAIYSARLFRKKQIMQNRMVGNLLIAAGGLLPALGGVAIRLELPELKYIGLLLGAILIFIGFLMATNTPEDAPVSHRTAPRDNVTAVTGAGD